MYDDEDKVIEITPPFFNEHDVNVAPLILCALLIELNSNTPPFPDSLLIESNVLFPFIVNSPAFTDINGVLYVE